MSNHCSFFSNNNSKCIRKYRLDLFKIFTSVLSILVIFYMLNFFNKGSEKFSNLSSLYKYNVLINNNKYIQMLNSSMNSAKVTNQTFNYIRLTSSARDLHVIPYRLHHLAKNEDLPSPYGMALIAFLRLHRVSNPLPNCPSDDSSGKPQTTKTSRALGKGSAHLQTAQIQTAPVTQSIEEPVFDYHFWTDEAIAAYKSALLEAAASDRACGSTTNSRFSSNLKCSNKSEFYRILNFQLLTSEMTDVMRYFILYEFGGVYMDLDMEVVRPITSFIRRGYPCVLSEEHPIQVRCTCV